MATPFQPARVVLAEQRAALRALAGLHCVAAPAPGSSGPESVHDQTRMVVLAIKVLTQAAVTAESSCRRILRAAETEAAAIVRDAQDDVNGRAARPPPSEPDQDRSHEGGAQIPTDSPSLAAGAPVVGRHIIPRPQPSHPDPGTTDAGNAFFESFDPDDEARWDFMDRDDREAMGQAILRRVLRRPSGRRRQPVS